MAEHQTTPKAQEILVVEDTPTSLQFLLNLLTEAGFLVRPASSGPIALRSASLRQPDLILLDVKMPKMDGYQVCHHLKAMEQTRSIPVVFLSAMVDADDKLKGFNAGGIDYITKPFEPQEVLARIKLHLRLKGLTENLEHEVQQRTTELTLTNQKLQQQIAERQRAEEKLSWEVGVNQAVAELSKNLLSTTSVDDISYLTLQHAKHLTNSAFGYVSYIDQETGYLVCPTLKRDIWSRCKVADKDVIFKEFTGLWGWVLNNQKSLLSNAPSDDPRSSGTPPGHVPIHRFLSAPSLIGEALVGQVSVANSDHDYTNSELEVIERLANLYAIAIQRKLAEEELQRHRDHLEELVEGRTAELEDSNKELEAFAYSVSHDLRAPLRHIDGFLELLQQHISNRLDDRLDTQIKHYMDTIANSAQHMGLLIDNLLSFSRVGRRDLSRQFVDLNQIVRDVIKELEPDIAHRDIHWRIEKLPTVTGDYTMLEMVFNNLITNALKFTRPRRSAKIDIGHLPANDEEHTIYVHDNGVGFEMQYADKLFGVFQRLHLAKDFEGTGIGLANVRRIIARHGGRTWAEGQVDLGATFYFSLPLNQNEDPA